jgi:putative transposase
LSAHVIHRGNNRCAIVGDDDDRQNLLVILELAARENGTAIHGYALMTTHIHLLATPEHADALPNTMQEFGGRYVPYFNRRSTRVGTLWCGRYDAFLIETERYWLNALRYIEQNPVRAGMVAAAEDYRWSSYRAHAFGEGYDWLTPHPLYDSLGRTPDERQAAYRALCSQLVSKEEVVPRVRPLSGTTKGSDPSTERLRVRVSSESDLSEPARTTG